MKMVKNILLTGLLAGAVLQAEATLIADDLTGGNTSGGWTAMGAAFRYEPFFGLSPVEGSWFYGANGWSGTDRGCWKLFSGNVFTQEVLQVTFYMGEFPELAVNGFPLPQYLHIGLFADVNSDGLWSLDEMIDSTTSTNPVPDNGWEQWVNTYNISASTTTTGGSNVLGKTIGFCVYADGGGGTWSDGRSMAFDSLTIETYERETTLITDDLTGADISGGWTAFSGGFVWGTAGGLDPIEGGWQFSARNWSGNDKGAWKLFGEGFIEENLQVTYWMGERTDGNGFPTSAYLQTGLFADVNGDGNWSVDEMIVPSTGTRPTPNDNWEQWVDSYEITASTTTVGGSNVVGKTIGFCVYADGGGVDRSMAFDSLRIETITAIVPNPAHLSVSRDGSNVLITVTDLYPSSSVSNVLEKTTNLNSGVWTGIMPYSIGSETNIWSLPMDGDDAAFFRVRSLY